MAACILWSMTLSSCLGSFKVTKKLYEWNDGINTKLGKNAVFWLLVIIPIYEIFLFVDIIVLNLIEFWSGGDPMSMNEGDIEEQLVMGKDGNNYKVTATKNRFDILQLDGQNCGVEQSFVYNPEDRSWSHVKNGVENKLVGLNKDGLNLVINSPTEKIIVPLNVDLATAQRMSKAQLENVAIK